MSLGKPPRLEQVFQKYDPPVYFLTLCTKNRRRALANATVHSVLIDYGRAGLLGGCAVGRYVIMPDFDLGIWVRGLKRVVAAAVSGGRGGLWQRGFFDHLIRNSESYSEKRDYVLENPVRAGLVSADDKWPFQGEIVPIDHG